MQLISFSKFNATGNDFIIIDNRQSIVNANDSVLWKKICSLKTGIGADGVLLLEKSTKADFKMKYINADGGEVEMCGNGARAITAFASERIDHKKETYQFETMNGLYECGIDKEYGYKLKMTELYDVDKIKLNCFYDQLQSEKSLYLNTGVPHCVFEVKNLNAYPVFQNGNLVRYNSLFEKGTNANFFEVISNGHLKIRTYERGVENETLSCGTGITATAIAAARFYDWKNQIVIDAVGGKLAVNFSSDFKEVYLCGPAIEVFKGEITS